MDTTTANNSYKADVYSFSIDKDASIVNLTINNVISWEWTKIILTQEELRGLANFIIETIGETK